MKNVLLIFNDVHSPETVLSFIKKNLKTSDFLFHGIFIKRLHTDQAFNYNFPNDLSATAVDYTSASDAEESYSLLKSYQQYFEDECQLQNIKYKTDIYADASVGQLIELSTSSDLILTDSATEFNDDSLKDILVKAHCPLFLIASKTTVIENVILAYDGSENSQLAIKSYGSLFTEWSHLPTQLTIVVAGEEEHSDKELEMKNWLEQHFSNVSTKVLHGKPKEALIDYINQTSNTLVVMGAFGRNALSRWANKSLAEVVYENTGAALFITHQ